LRKKTKMMTVTSQNSAEASVKIKEAARLFQQGNLAAAESLCQQILSQQPEPVEARYLFDALHLSGIIAYARQQPERAVSLLKAALAIHPNDASALNSCAAALVDAHQYDDAVTSADQAIAINQNYASAHNNRGNALLGLKRLEDALLSYEKAVALNPDFAPAYKNRGAALLKLGRPQDALSSFAKAVALNPHDPKAHSGHSMALMALAHYHEALASYDAIIALTPEDAEAHNDRGIVLGMLGRRKEAVESYRRAIAAKPDHVDARMNLSLTHLQMGDFSQGWETYEWRWNNKAFASRAFSAPLWCGDSPVRGKTILLHAEQGLGDTLHFCRYAKNVADLGARVILEVQRPLLTLLQGLEGVAQVIARGETLPAVDFQCPLLSLPSIFKTDTTCMPAASGYIKSDPDKVREWRSKLGAKVCPRVGFVWSGNPSQKSDAVRSINLSELLRALPPSCEYLSLQKDVKDSDRKLLESRPDILAIGASFQDFSDTAAVCEDLDVVVTVCTSVAHLAGAMGKPVWVLLSYNPCWRWLLDRTDSPWYSSAKLYRQNRMGDWASVLGSLKADLQTLHLA